LTKREYVGGMPGKGPEETVGDQRPETGTLLILKSALRSNPPLEEEGSLQILKVATGSRGEHQHTRIIDTIYLSVACYCSSASGFTILYSGGHL
jgi:hypothetical protein